MAMNNLNELLGLLAVLQDSSLDKFTLLSSDLNKNTAILDAS